MIRTLYEGYLGGLALMEAAKAAGLKLYHGSAKRMMQNRHYLGDAYYPVIIDQNTFDAALAEQQKRATISQIVATLLLSLVPPFVNV